MNIITDFYETCATIDDAYTAQFGGGAEKLIKLTAGRIIQKLLRELKEQGHHPNTNSIVARHWHDDTKGAIQLRAVWSPDTSEGVYLQYGPCDGNIVAIPVTPTRVPPLVFPFKTTWDGQEFNYRRLGVDDDENRWVYTFIGAKTTDTPESPA